MEADAGEAGPVDLVIEAEAWASTGLSAIADQAARATLGHLGLDPDAFTLALLACDDARIAGLNREFRGKAAATNVLSWASEDRSAELSGEVPDRPKAGELGDIAIAWETCCREAQDQGKALEDHVLHLVVHSVLHLLGYDHETEDDAALMERTEVEILDSLGLPDPYTRPEPSVASQLGKA